MWGTKKEDESRAGTNHHFSAVQHLRDIEESDRNGRVTDLEARCRRLETHVQMLLLATGFELHLVPAVQAHEQIRKRKPAR